MDKSERQHNYVGDVGVPRDSLGDKASIGFGMVVFAIVTGFVIGLVVWCVFWASSALTSLLWGYGAGAIGSALSAVGIPSMWIPVAFCTFGGLLIGLWTWKVGGEPEPLEVVMAKVKSSGSYALANPLASVVGFLLPLVFGGSIGPEAGLTGIIAAACSKIGLMLKSAGLKIAGLVDVTVSAVLSAVFTAPFAGIVAASQGAGMQALDPDDYEFRRKAKLVLYTASAFGAVLGIAAFASVFGSEGGIPRFEGVTPGANKLWWALPCIACGYLAALLFHGSGACCMRISAKIGEHPVLKPVVAGFLLGLLGMFLPLALFPGESQTRELMETWTTLGGAVLIATGFAKCFATQLCLNFGWRGGHFFPCIFAGVALGYGVALLGGFEPMFCVAITTAVLVAGIQRKPLMAIALLLLCFPAQSIVWVGIAALIGASLPMPRSLFSDKTEPNGGE